MCSAPTGCTACGDRKGSRCRPTAINHVWAYDFVFDTCANGQTLKCLTIIDEFTRECPRSMSQVGFGPRASSKCSRSS